MLSVLFSWLNNYEMFITYVTSEPCFVLNMLYYDPSFLQFKIVTSPSGQHPTAVNMHEVSQDLE